MRQSLSPSAHREIDLCNRQKNNKRCLIFSLNSAFQFVLSGYSEQSEKTDEDINSLKSLLKFELCFILYNINKYSNQCKWILILWMPDEGFEKGSNMKSEKNEKNEKNHNRVSHLNKLIYHNLKNKILDIINDSDISFFQIKTFEELEQCINRNVVKFGNPNDIDTNCLDILTNETDKNKQLNIKRCLYNNYIINLQMKNLYYNFIEKNKLFIEHIKLVKEEKNPCLLFLKLNTNNYEIISDYIIVQDIEYIKNIINNENLFYTVYKILDTYTFFFVCNEKCHIKDKFVYSFFKTEIIQVLKKNNIIIFLSIEISKPKHVLDFIHSDILKTEKKKKNIFKNNFISNQKKS
ncbi:conserved Plasmodium protein, unknown function [Plasmodium chabaudi adami]|uniref:ADF-H domain-containing protein n=1 Tax=Plasmodium chabaudi adami TaxID=5826 RepID=A0A1C6YQD7_PLACE|nr:conserved Plasmodium protein, unknown function [Plasmodium chabaudi adami]